jgi:hypothetical protein
MITQEQIRTTAGEFIVDQSQSNDNYRQNRPRPVTTGNCDLNEMKPGTDINYIYIYIVKLYHVISISMVHTPYWLSWLCKTPTAAHEK